MSKELTRYEKTHYFSDGKVQVTVYSQSQDNLRVNGIGVVTHIAPDDTVSICSSGANERAVIHGLSNLQFVIDALSDIRDKIIANQEAEAQEQARQEMEDKLRSVRLNISCTKSGY